MKFFYSKLELLYNKVTKKEVVISTIVFLVFTGLVLPFVTTYTTGVIGVAKSPDTSFSFNLITLYNLVDSYGQEGRRFYIIIRWTFDSVWPLVYTTFLLLSISFFSKEVKYKHGIKLLFFPLLAFLFDILENINATIVMSVYPTKIDAFGYLLFTSSILKWLAVYGSFVTVVILVLVLFVKGFKKH